MSRTGEALDRWWSLWWGLAYLSVAVVVWYSTDDRFSAYFAGAMTVYAQHVLDGSILDWKAHWRALRRARNSNRFAAAHPEIDRTTRGLERDIHNALYPPTDKL